jgi:hypothetical protein
MGVTYAAYPAHHIPCGFITLVKVAEEKTTTLGATEHSPA